MTISEIKYPDNCKPNQIHNVETDTPQINISDDIPILLSAKEIGTDYSYKHEIIVKDVLWFLVLYVMGLWGMYNIFTGRVQISTLLWSCFIGLLATEGVTIGAHRYYSHRCFKAKPVLRALFLLGQTVAGQFSMFKWCRDHRLHHRYSDTDADPHNAKRGLFFSHIGWVMMNKHPYVIELGKTIDMSDLEADWMVMFQKKYYLHLFFMFVLFIPICVPVYFFGETWLNSFLVCFAFRYSVSLNQAMLINSAGHHFGNKPYDKNIQPVDAWFLAMITGGEGWHNYHHTFPWDYRTSELPTLINLSSKIINFLEKIGLVYDLKTANPETVRNRILKTGDGTHHELGDEESRAVITSLGPLHPLNPLYKAKYRDMKPGYN